MITIREMQIDDLEQVMPIEEANFSIPWTETGFPLMKVRSQMSALQKKREDAASAVH